MSKKEKEQSVYAAKGWRKLYQPLAGGAWFVRFKFMGKNFKRSLGTNELKIAKEKAIKLVESVINGQTEVAEATKVRRSFADLETIGQLYIKSFGDTATRNKTARGNVGALAKIIRIVHGRTLAQAHADLLTGDLIAKFEAAMLETIPKNGKYNSPRDEFRVRYSLGSVVRHARSIFSPGTLHWFKGQVLPDLTPFRQRKITPAKKVKPKAVNLLALAEMNEAAEKMQNENPALYLTFVLFSRLGMRNSEIEAARWSWISKNHDGSYNFAIVNQLEQDPPFFCKGTERTLSLGKSVLDVLFKHRAESPDGDFLIPARNLTHRAEIINREHSAWARKWLKTSSSTKISYELRRYAGSRVYQLCGGDINKVQEFLGHKNQQTTLDWYFYLMGNKSAVIEMDNLVA